MSSERQRKFHKQKSHSDENIQMGIYTTEALAYQPENEPIQLQNNENQKKTSKGEIQIDFDEQMKASIKDFNYFQKNEEEISEKMLQKSSKGNIKNHKKSNSDENIIMNNTQEISLKFNSDHQESEEEEERFNTLHMQNSNNSEIQSQENLPAENFNKILEKNKKKTDEFNDFNNFGQDLSDLIRAFEIQQSQDPNAPHLKQLVQQKLLKKSENLQLQTDTQNNLQQKKQEQKKKIMIIDRLE
ncbi:hypothetical protein PPERSA_07079 [Pseudocohnilembus persalinus]|uniref:Uncharacterized protein n=1 Tax=Pseudocohnilembus persalinus TaxID=266149 RepID=A0A0V0QXJ6_PSEPJ|nr:hypothetical protein PPERSA_07079 [Pseudocohnilembus persalinus]|eukprot:KRX06916.1 hypothetical protein PPERSA_07079 [Pseudocohnilembus persalinus]